MKEVEEVKAYLTDKVEDDYKAKTKEHRTNTHVGCVYVFY